MHDISGAELDACLITYDYLQIPDALLEIQSHGWGVALLAQAKEIEVLSAQKIQSLRREVNKRLQCTAVDINVQERIFSSSASSLVAERGMTGQVNPETSHKGTKGQKWYRSLEQRKRTIASTARPAKASRTTHCVDNNKINDSPRIQEKDREPEFESTSTSSSDSESSSDSRSLSILAQSASDQERHRVEKVMKLNNGKQAGPRARTRRDEELASTSNKESC
ncbi:hypothetical protein HOY82DRAFT_601276 [Tuber indicum]|nr:hypothetical protein HOY82DRAFT_601276 [Tuber indicum]